MDNLIKMTNPSDIAHLSRQDETGPQIVDHNFHMSADKHPEAIDFDTNIVQDPNTIPSVAGSSKNLQQTTSPIGFYRSPKTGQKFLIKPYHEPVVAHCLYTRFPIQGWAEMANQALYHSAGIGRLTSKAHVQDLDTSTGRKPMVVVSMNPKVNAHLQDFDKYTGPYPHELYDDSVKMGMMDFLTNNNDRHGYNAMFTKPRGKGTASNLLGVDHGRSFNYKWPNRWTLPYNHPIDSLYAYIAGGADSAHERLARPDLNWSPWNNAHLQHGVSWWKDNRQKIRDEMKNQLQAIKHDEVRNYIDKNFNFRTQAMDKFAGAWDKNPEAFDYEPLVNPQAMRIHGVPMLPFLPPSIQKSELLEKMEGQTYGDGVNEWHVPLLAQHVTKHFPITQVPTHNLHQTIKDASTDEPWGSPAFHSRAMKADLKHPLILVQHPEGLHVADGMHRLYRHIQNGATHIPAYVVPHDKMPKEALANGVSNATNT